MRTRPQTKKMKEDPRVETMKCFLHGKIGKLGKKRSRTEINIMLKEGTCNHQENKRKKRKKND